MIKKFTTLLSILSVTFALNAQIQTPQPSPGAKIEQTVGMTTIKVDYSRPSMRGRVVFGDLVPYGKLWRTGANMRTSISFGDDVTIEGQELKKGTYAIFSVPSEDSWDVIFYTEYNAGGAPQELDNSKVALKVNVKTGQMANAWESFTIAFGDFTNDSANLYIAWEKTMVRLNVGVPSDAIAMKSIETTMAGPAAGDYFQAAVYYLTSGKDLNQAKTWIDKAVEMDGENQKFWVLRQQSLIYAGLNKKKEAVAIAEKSLKLAEKYKNADYVKMNKESITEWSK
ncbi:DUF2911 domain-containing protein [Urechidicola vernalis]|uniref:DUF2911 domain-containing protein n=1 Tax=Urechidicola vernalis TaxID=3075600 RepID=A0ABU2Y6X9_9FLAO|nr:DUF2911 domain-containing protein [Urechidicola sp. P050]MDT0553797.1 DUF2911 domain-containing protein [Urechidicola sp. P050]